MKICCLVSVRVHVLVSVWVVYCVDCVSGLWPPLSAGLLFYLYFYYRRQGGCVCLHNNSKRNERGFRKCSGNADDGKWQKIQDTLSVSSLIYASLIQINILNIMRAGTGNVMVHGDFQKASLNFSLTLSQ